MFLAKFPYYKQLDLKDCGPTCLKIIAKHYDRTISIQRLRRLSETIRTGTNLMGLSNAAEKIGFRTMAVKISLSDLNQVPLPCVLHWKQNHFVVLYKIKKQQYYLSDPAYGLRKLSAHQFKEGWIGVDVDDNLREGIALLMEPSINHTTDDDVLPQQKDGGHFGFVKKYISRYRGYLWQLLIGLLAASVIQFLIPFLTQSVVDIGIKNQDLNFIYLILFAQLALFAGRTCIQLIRSWIVLHLSIRINIAMVSDFFIKLMRLPISFFDTKMTGDLMQRIQDHKRIEQLLTTSTLDLVFSFFSVVIFSFVLFFYSWKIVLVFLIGSMMYFMWILMFLKKRKDLDHSRFEQLSHSQSKIIEMINGMQDIKLHNAEKRMRWNWEFTQARLYRIATKNLIVEQYQSVGSDFINELKNILITIFAATLVIDGELTLGMMLAISFIIGQLNGPIALVIHFVREWQDARISSLRLSEIHQKDDEEPYETIYENDLPNQADINLNKVCFRYQGSAHYVLENLSLKIPFHKVTAIVGVSGSGKTTLMKLLLKFYQPQQGNISLGATKLENITHKQWREASGVVMQEGFIFSDTIAQNIAVGEDIIDKNKLTHAVKVANAQDFIEALPLSYNTKIGMEGTGLSTGQKQRILIARAVYKAPSFLFFDEATSALDANNEKQIHQNLQKFFEQKTVLIIAHRLSTVKNADQIVVMSEGKIVEKGTHEELISTKSHYYHLVKNQLELGD